MSSDRDQSQFEEYFKEMPWLALDFADRDLKAGGRGPGPEGSGAKLKLHARKRRETSEEQLSQIFKVDGIPSLVSRPHRSR